MLLHGFWKLNSDPHITWLTFTKLSVQPVPVLVFSYETWVWRFTLYDSLFEYGVVHEFVCYLCAGPMRISISFQCALYRFRVLKRAPLYCSYISEMEKHSNLMMSCLTVKSWIWQWNQWKKMVCRNIHRSWSIQTAIITTLAKICGYGTDKERVRGQAFSWISHILQGVSSGYWNVLGG